MAGAKLIITFLRDAFVGEYISFDITKIDTATTVNCIETFVEGDPRTNAFTIPVIDNLGGGTTTTALYRYYIAIDYSFFYVTTLSPNTIQIEAINKYFEFSNVLFEGDDLIEYQIINLTPATFLLTDVVTSAADDVCGDVKLSLDTTELIKKIKLNGVQIETNNFSKPYLIDLKRGIINNLILENADGQLISYPPSYVLIFASFSVSNIKVDIKNKLNGGATVTINVFSSVYINTIGNLTFEYSLNNIDWQVSNIFTGQAPGDYTAYVRDQYGCKKQVDYVVDSFGTRLPFFFLSKANGINFSEQVDFDDINIFKNDENTLSFQSLSNVKYCEPILYNIGDKPIIQFKSNYNNITAVLRKEDLTEVNLIINKRTSNLNRYESMDAVYYKYDVGLLGIYFENGKTYDKFGFENGQYDLSGNLPDFAIIGQYIGLKDLGYFEIIDVLYDYNIGKKSIIINYLYDGIPVSTIIESIYNLLPYEIYEFEIDFSDFEVGLVDVLLTNSDEANGTIYHLSENIYLKHNHEETLHIKYYNENNRDIFYKYGIQHFIRVLFSNITGGIKDDSEINEGDLTVSLNNSSVREVNTFLFTDLTTERMRTLSIALSCKNVFINGCGYVKLELSHNPIDGTNLHDLEAKMIKTNINYNNNRQGQIGVDEDYVSFNIPSLIKSGNGFIKS